MRLFPWSLLGKSPSVLFSVPLWAFTGASLVSLSHFKHSVILQKNREKTNRESQSILQDKYLLLHIIYVREDERPVLSSNWVHSVSAHSSGFLMRSCWVSLSVSCIKSIVIKWERQAPKDLRRQSCAATGSLSRASLGWLPDNLQFAVTLEAVNFGMNEKWELF